MEKNDHLRPENPDFISGIFNYCDRWCERCPLTSRCRLYAMQQEQSDEAESRDLNNAAFWESLRNTFDQTLEMIEDFAEEDGVDLNSVDVELEMERERELHEQAENHPLAQAAMQYTKRVDTWFKAEEQLFAQKDEELMTKLDWGIPQSALEPEAESILDSVEVIRWYQHQIYVKLMRGLWRDDIDDFEEERNFPKDSDGSAKVALLEMDRSISAWGILRNHFREKTDDILSILLHLDRLRRSTEKEFPDARGFVRPGFDRMKT